MSYQTTVDTCRTAALTVLNGTGRFDHGRHVDIAQAFDGDYPLIFLYPITIVPPDSPDFLDRWSGLIGFWMQDRPDTSNAEREAIIAQMYNLSKLFLEELESNIQIRVTGKRGEAQYQMYQGTLSGFAYQLTIQNFDAC